MAEATDAATLHADVSFWSHLLGLEPPVYLPTRDPADLGRRLQAIEGILEGRCRMVVTSPDAVLAPVWSVEEFRRSFVRVNRGEEIDIETLAGVLSEMGYRRMNLAAESGEFAIRGGIVDVYPAAEENPYRIEFFRDMVESVRVFDVDTQRSYREVESFALLPAREPEGGRSLLEALSGWLRLPELQVSKLAFGFRESVVHRLIIPSVRNFNLLVAEPYVVLFNWDIKTICNKQLMRQATRPI